MADFVYGTVVDNLREPGLTCDIILRARNNSLIKVFDSILPGLERPLGDQIIPDQIYTLLITLAPRQITLLGIQPDESLLNVQIEEQTFYPYKEIGEVKTFALSNIIQGKIIDLRWTIAALPEEQRQVLADLQNETYLLLETAIGHLIINHENLSASLEGQIEQLVPGEHIIWEPTRLELLAILSPYIAY
jgi:hypothetical protein